MPSQSQSQSQSSAMIKVAVIGGAFTLAAALITAILGPALMDWIRRTPTPTESTLPATAAHSPATPGVDVPFAYTMGSGSGVTIAKVTASRSGSRVWIVLDYQADGPRQVLLYDPPDGGHVSMWRNIDAGPGQLAFDVDAQQLRQVSELTVGFKPPQAGTADCFVSLSFNAIAPLST